MRFGYCLLVAPALIAAAPASAQQVVFVPGAGTALESTYHQDDRDMADIADRIDDPQLQDGIASTVEGVSAGILNLPIGPFADAMERVRPGTVDPRLPHDATIGDIAGHDSAYLAQEFGDRSREILGAAGGLARALAVMLPEFERMGDEMEASIRAAKVNARRYRD